MRSAVLVEPSDTNVITATSTRAFVPWPVMVATTGWAVVLPVSGSVALTLSPSLSFSIGLLVPSARRTLVPGTKELRFPKLSSFLIAVTPSSARSLSRPTSSAAFFHFQGAPYLARSLPATPPAKRSEDSGAYGYAGSRCRRR